MMDQETQSTESAPVEETAASGDNLEVSDSILQLETVAAERDKLRSELDESAQRQLRLTAEFDNFRKRAEREKSEVIEYAAADTLKALLPVLDDFDRALKTETADAEYAKGIALIHQRLSDIVTKIGLEHIPAEGQPFDPNLHYAVDRTEDAEAEMDMVVAEYQKGYRFKGRLLRPAMVRVAVKP